jgi:hypothetical protein
MIEDESISPVRHQIYRAERLNFRIIGKAIGFRSEIIVRDGITQ